MKKMFVIIIVLVLAFSFIPCVAEGVDVFTFAELYSQRLSETEKALDYEIRDIQDYYYNDIQVPARYGEGIISANMCGGTVYFSEKDMSIVAWEDILMASFMNDEQCTQSFFSALIAISVFEYGIADESILRVSENKTAFDMLYDDAFDDMVAVISDEENIAIGTRACIYSGKYDYYIDYVKSNDGQDWAVKIYAAITDVHTKTADSAMEKFDDVKISSGRYIVGADIPSGFYRCVCKGAYSSVILKVFEKESDKWPIIDEILAELYNSSIIGKLELKDGNILDISGGDVYLTTYEGITIGN